jgi:hypothetical protein
VPIFHEESINRVFAKTNPELVELRKVVGPNITIWLTEFTKTKVLEPIQNLLSFTVLFIVFIKVILPVRECPFGSKDNISVEMVKQGFIAEPALISAYRVYPPQVAISPQVVTGCQGSRTSAFALGAKAKKANRKKIPARAFLKLNILVFIISLLGC